jgi:hypothetical protein
LKPSITSRRSPSRAARMGRSASVIRVGDCGRLPRRNGCRLVARSSMGIWCTRTGSSATTAGVMGPCR